MSRSRPERRSQFQQQPLILELFLVLAPFFGALLGPASARALPSLSICVCNRVQVKLDASPRRLRAYIIIFFFFIHTCAKDMQWESSSMLPTGGDEHCPFSSGKLVPSERDGEDHACVITTGDRTGNMANMVSPVATRGTAGKKIQWAHKDLPGDGLLLSGGGGTNSNSGCMGGLL